MTALLDWLGSTSAHLLALFALGDQGWGDEMLRGAGMTIILSICGFCVGLLFGTMGAAAKLSGNTILSGAVEAYTTVVRGIPELLVIYLFFFGTSGAITFVASLFGYSGFVGVDAFTIGVIVLGLISGAYMTEVIRGALQAVPRGQGEAARALGLSGIQTFIGVRVPQAARLAIPGLGNVWQLILKDSALISVTALAEIMRVASVATRSTREPFTFYLAAGVLYLLITTVSTVLFSMAERRARRGTVQARP